MIFIKDISCRLYFSGFLSDSLPAWQGTCDNATSYVSMHTAQQDLQRIKDYSDDEEKGNFRLVYNNKRSELYLRPKQA